MEQNYGAMDDRSDTENGIPLVPAESRETLVEVTDESKMEERLKNPFDETYFTEDDFYNIVCERYDKVKDDPSTSWRGCETRSRLEKLKTRFQKIGVDPLVGLLTTCFDDYQAVLLQFPNEKLHDAFEQQLSDFAAILLDEDNTGVSKYVYGNLTRGIYRENNIKVTDPYNIPDNENGTTILHLCAHRNLCQVASKYLQLYPNTICRKDYPTKGRSRMPVEVALDARNDDMCALLMARMLNEKVRGLFTCDDPDEMSRYRLSELVVSGTMKKTVLAVLDSCVNPDIPFLKKYEQDESSEQEVWEKLPTIPLRYNFFFEALDGDYDGAFVGKEEEGYMNFEYSGFNVTSPSPLQMITMCVEDDTVAKDPIRHMVVRQLVRKKWNDYGQFTVLLQCIVYFLYLLSLSLALFISAKQSDPRQYRGGLNVFRGVCEGVGVLMTLLYFVVEVVQMGKEIAAKVETTEDDNGKMVKKYSGYLPWIRIIEPSTVLYIFSLLGILLLIPCQILKYHQAARSIATVAYLVLFLRLSDYFTLHVDFGTYSNTFKEIIKIDIKQFIVIIAFVVLAFSGSIYLAMAAAGAFGDGFDNFWTILLQEIRAMFEGKEFADSYSKYHVLLTLHVLVSMFAIIIVMGNVLIGQISERYTSAKNSATIQYDIDKARLLVRIERSVFPFLRNQRRKHFRKGLYVSNQELIKDLIADWNTYFAQESDGVQDVQDLVNKKILKQREASTNTA